MGGKGIFVLSLCFVYFIFLVFSVSNIFFLLFFCFYFYLFFRLFDLFFISIVFFHQNVHSLFMSLLISWCKFVAKRKINKKKSTKSIQNYKTTNLRKKQCQDWLSLLLTLTRYSEGDPSTLILFNSS